jgi:Domain of unknown function (DUF4279)
MLIRQYVYFALKSEEVSAAQLAVLIGLQPDRVRVRGAKQAEPPVPVCHSWEIESGGDGPIDQQIALIVSRLAPVLDRIVAVVKELNASGVLQIVRFIDGRDSDDVSASGWQPLADPSPLLGWHLDRQVVDFIAASGCEVDVDEYLQHPKSTHPQ